MLTLGYSRRLKSGVVITNIQEEHVYQLEALQEIIYPTLAPEERFKAEHYLHHLQMFPEGQFCAVLGEKVVGTCSAIRLNFDFEHTDHTFADLLQGGYMTSHEPDGEWLYGMDMGTHPDYRKMGIARGLYYARQSLVRKCSLRGQVAGGMMSGYGNMKQTMRAEAYFDKLKRGDLVDPTISAQMKVGFEPFALLPNYINDPVCDNYGVLIVLDASKDVYSE